MKTKNLYSYTLIVLVIFLILGNITNCGASIPQTNYIEFIHKLDCAANKIWSTKIMNRLFIKGKISNQNFIVPPRVAHVIPTEPDARRHPGPEILKWNIEVKEKIYSIHVNRDDKTVTVRGEAEDWKERENIEHVLKMRAPSNFQIINELDVFNDLS